MGRTDLPVQSHPFVAGLATNLADQALRPPNLARLENCVFLPRGSLSKRPGCTDALGFFSSQDAAGNWTHSTILDSIRSMFTSRDELVAVDADGVPVTWSTANSTWWSQASQGNLLAPKITVRPAIKDGTVHTAFDAAQAAGWRLTVWQPINNVAGGLKFCVQDSTTGALIIPPTAYGNSFGRYPAAIAVGNTLYALWVDVNAGSIRGLRITVTTTPAVAGGTDQLITANIRAPFVYDSDTDANGNGVSTFAAISYSATSTIETVTLNAAGTITNGPTAESGTGGSIETIGVAVDPIASNIGMAWVRSSGGTRSLRAVIRTSALGAVAAETVVHNAYGTNVPQTQTACVFQSSTTGGNRVMHILYADGLAGTPIVTPMFVRHATFNTAAGVGGPNIYAQNALISSRAFRDQGTMMVTLYPMLGGSVFWKHILCSLGGTGSPASPIAYYKGKYINPSSGAHLSPIAVFNEGGLFSLNGVTCLSHVLPLGNRTFLLAVGVPGERLLDAVSFGGGDFFDITTAHAVMDFSAPALQAVAVNGVTYLSGGMLQQHDAGVAEAGFVTYLDPLLVTFTPSAGGSLTASASYSYVIRKEWMNARGITERSTFIPKTVSTGAGQTRFTLTIPTDPFSARHLQRPFSYQIYRTIANPPTNPTYYRVSNLDPADTAGSNRYVANDPSVGTLTFVDDRSDASLAQFGELDITPNQLDPINVPHCSCLATDGNRLWVAGLDDPNVVWPSMLVSGFGNGVEFNEALQQRVDDYGGDITALAVLNDRLIVFKERAIYAIIGDGPDNTGANGSFSTPQLIHSDVGCTQPTTVAITPLGVMFMSAKGFCMLDQALNVKYIGAAVEAYNAKTFTAAVVLPKQRQVRFLSNASPSLVYDYEIDQWAAFTGGHFGTAAAVYLDSQFVYGTSGGTARFEDATYQDGTTEYGMLLETSWLHGASLQALLRGGRIAVLGKYYSPHQLRLTVYYDYDDSAGIVINETPAGANAVQQVRFDLPARHDFQAVKFRLEEISLGAPALTRSFSIVELAVELADEGGIMRLAASRSA